MRCHCQRIEVVNFVVEQPLFQGAQVPPGSSESTARDCFGVEVVQHRVLVAAVVVVGDPTDWYFWRSMSGSTM